MGVMDRLRHGWNAFLNNRDPTSHYRNYTYGEGGTSYRPDRPRFSRGNERTIVNAICNKIAIDVAGIDIRHVRLDEDDRFKENIESSLDYCLTTEANIDQTGRSFKQDIVMSMLDEGVIAVVPVDTDIDPRDSTSFKIETMRVGKVVEWFPKKVRINLYNDRTGNKEDVTLPKSAVALIENPLFAVMNEPNSTMKRLVRKLALLDAIDEQSGSGKLDLIIQLPYVVKTEARRNQAESRRKDIEDQLAGSKYGIAYTDGTERITQLNRPVENNLLKQIEYLTAMLYSQLGITQAILDGTADEATMLNYNNRTIEPIISAIVDEMKRKFLTKTARSQKQTLMFFRDPFKLVPVSELAKIGDTMTRNEIMTSNEIRQKMGMKPSSDPKADQLVNSNMPQPTGAANPEDPESENVEPTQEELIEELKRRGLDQ